MILRGYKKTALYVIFNEKSYTKRLQLSKLDRLGERGEEMYKKFATKTMTNKKISHWFVKKQNPKITVQKILKF